MTTEERLEMLEDKMAAEKRLTRRLMFGAGIILGMFILFVAFRAITGVAYGQAEKKVIRANEFVLENEQGKICAILTVTEDGPVLNLYDENGKIRAELGMTKVRVPGQKVPPKGKSLLRKLESRIASLDWIEKGPGLSLYDENGEGNKIMLGLDKRLEQKLILGDKDGELFSTELTVFSVSR